MFFWQQTLKLELHYSLSNQAITPVNAGSKVELEPKGKKMKCGRLSVKRTLRYPEL